MNAKQEISEHARECLQESGWKPGRSIDVSDMLGALSADGYDPPRAARRLLEEYGLLEIAYPSHRSPGDTDRFHFDVFKVVRHTFPENVELWSRRVGKPLCPVGEIQNYMTILVAYDGAVYAALDDDILYLGPNIQVAIDGLCVGLEFEELD